MGVSSASTADAVPGGDAWIANVVDHYLAQVSDLVYLRFPAHECRARLGAVFSAIVHELQSPDFTPAVGRRLGEALVSLQILAPDAAASAARVVAGLPAQLSPTGTADRAELGRRVGLVVAELVGGYAAALASVLIDGQTVVQRAAYTERQAAVESEKQAQARIRIMFEHARSPGFLADEHGRLIEASPSMATMMAANRSLLGPDGDDLRSLLSDNPRDADQVFAELAAADDESVTRFLEHRRLLDGGDLNVGRWALSRVRSQGDQPAMIVGIGQDVTELLALHARLDHLAHHDPLTGIPNRRRLESDLANFPTGTPFGFCLIDLDDFKSVNDRLGHAAGDQLLVAAAARMQSALGGKGALYRLGGDEFAVVISPPFRPRDAVEVVQRVLARPVNVRITDGTAGERTEPIRIAASIGVTTSSAARNSVEDLITDADTGLYRSKQARRA